MLNMKREDLILAIETIDTDSKATIEWNLELIDVDLCANRGTQNGGLVRAYQLLAEAKLQFLNL